MKRYLFIYIFTIVSLGMSAQIGELRSQLSVGVNGGMAFSTVSFDPTIKQDQHQGMTLGVTARYTCEKYFATVCALQGEINYAQIGWKEHIMNSSGEELADTYQRNLNYVQIPLLARLGWGKEKGGVMFFVLLGPQVGFLLSEKAKQGATWTLNSENVPDRPNGVYQQYGMKLDNSFEYGLTGGLGLEVNTKHGKHFIIDGRYYYGLSDIYKNGKTDVFSRSANLVISARLTYLFDLFNR